jgi:hypothetical protein
VCKKTILVLFYVEIDIELLTVWSSGLSFVSLTDPIFIVRRH